jgi:hypothetical protein
LTYILTAAGVNTIPSMGTIYLLFGTLVIPDLISRVYRTCCSELLTLPFLVQLLLNCGFFVFLLHVMYTVFLAKLGIKPSLRSPRWLDRVMWKI